MNKILNYIKDAQGLPPRITIKKVFGKVKNKGLYIIDKISSNVFGTEVTNAEFSRKAWNLKYKFQNSGELGKHFRSRKKPEIFIDLSKREGITSVIISEANKICEHIFNQILDLG